MTQFNDGPYLEGWYPGLGEVLVLDSLPKVTREFLADAAEEDPSFITEYILPTLEEIGAQEIIEEDLSTAIAEFECERSGLGDLGFLGKKKNVFKKVRKAISKVHSKIIPKPLRKLEEKAKKIEHRVVKSVKKGAKKIWVKYGNIILEVIGVALAIFTGGAALAAVQVLIAANTAYQKKRQADKAKKAASKEAGQLQAEAQQANAATQRQVDDFFNQNQAWFMQYGITPDKWNSLTLDQKIGLIDAGSKGQLPKGSSTYESQDQAARAPSTSGPGVYPDQGAAPAAPTYGTMTAPGGTYMPSPGMMPSGASMQMPSGGGAGPDWGSFTPYGQGAGRPGGGGPSAPETVQAGVFGDGGGMLLPAALVAGAVLLSGSGRKGGGGGRRRRNPRRRR